MNKKRLSLQITGLLLVLLFIAACASMSKGPDYWPTEGWQTSTPEEQGMDSEMLAEMFDFIGKEDYDIHSVTIIRNGYLVADAAIYPFKADSKHKMYSCTKSIISALIGIAIEQGYIKSVKQPVLSFFPGRTVANLDANKEAMTLEHLLMMASGFEWRSSLFIGGIDFTRQMIQTDDWVRFMLDLPMAVPPGTRLEYCNGASFLLSAIIQETTGMTAFAFAEANLFTPLGISDVEWPSSPRGITIGYSELRMLPHDMAKIGFLYLNKGRWNGEQIIPAAWVGVSTDKHISAPYIGGYGYQWWTEDNGVYSAQGFAGQLIFVAPEHELVVVFSSNLSETDFRIPKMLVYYFIIPAVESSAALTANSPGVSLLESSIQQLGLTRDGPEVVPPLPEITQRVTGQTYLLDSNPFGLQSVALTFQKETEALMSWTLNPDETQAYLLDLQYWSKVEWPVGLDNVYRFTPGVYGIPIGLKGYWETETTFVILCDFIGNGGRWRIQFSFEGDQMTLQIWTENFGLLGKFSGRLEEHLPSELIKEIQKYISGAQVYIPGISENRLHWGEKNGTRKILENRNISIRNLKKSGVKIDDLADQFSLSPDSIRKILYKTDVNNIEPDFVQRGVEN